ncbi:class I SAM-dependent methyltransferase [Streptomyces physcomitrii]|uniref:SAM-dependent methyltransferase n=1 Tax=Streptomyces physcomitrii TaxID=2724184 RepID=A0ABX1H4H3_9ACTN|nr:SAM-dependent methyltransferase [Streptomyces physcomitrii]NKI42240.1 SAM-dependent methyltransferase [Streptomyces physcomitrii]
MTPMPVRQHPDAAAPPAHDPAVRARDWAEIQERMLVPLHVTVHERLGVGEGTRLLGLDCGAGLALLLASVRGAAVTGVESAHPERLALARERLTPREPEPGRSGPPAVLYEGEPGRLPAPAEPFTVVTALEPVGCARGDTARLVRRLREAAPYARRGARVVLTGWGPPERCAVTALRDAVLGGPGGPEGAPGGGRDGSPGGGPGGGPGGVAAEGAGLRAAGRDDLEYAAERAGLRPDGSGRVSCPFGYPDPESALRGLRATGLFDASDAPAGTDPAQTDKELQEALHSYRRPDGTVWLPNVFRYLLARIP